MNAAKNTIRIISVLNAYYVRIISAEGNQICPNTDLTSSEYRKEKFLKMQTAWAFQLQ